jgi:hypothetical protein
MNTNRVLANLMLSFLILTLVVAGCSFPPTPPPTSDYFVSIKGDDAKGNGTQGKPWRHVQYALNHVVPVGGAVPRIILAKGVYKENLVIQKAVIIQGAGVGQVSTWPNDPLTPTQDISEIVRADTSLPSILADNAVSVNLQDLVVWGGGIRAVNTRFIASQIEVQQSLGLFGIQLENCPLFYITGSKILTGTNMPSDYGLDLEASEGEINSSYLGDDFDHTININPVGTNGKLNPDQTFAAPHITIRDVTIAGSKIYYADGIRIDGPVFAFIESTQITRTHPDNEPANKGPLWSPPYAGIQLGGWIGLGVLPYVKIDGVTTSGFDVGIGTAQEGYDLIVQNSSIAGNTYAVQTSYAGYTGVNLPQLDFGGGYHGSVGKNTFGKDGKYAFYNDAPYKVDACYNDWQVLPNQIDSQRIFDKLDNPSKGRVNWSCSQQSYVIQPTPPSKVSPTATPGGRTVAIVKDDLCYLGPGPVYETVSAVKSGQVLPLIGIGDGVDFFIVENPIYKGVHCWVRIASTRFVGNTGDLRRILPPSTPTPIPPPTLTPTPTRRR